MTVQKHQDAHEKEDDEEESQEEDEGGLAAAAEHSILSVRMRNFSRRNWLQSHFAVASLNRCPSSSPLKYQSGKAALETQFSFNSDWSTLCSAVLFKSSARGFKGSRVLCILVVCGNAIPLQARGGRCFLSQSSVGTVSVSLLISCESFQLNG